MLGEEKEVKQEPAGEVNPWLVQVKAVQDTRDLFLREVDRAIAFLLSANAGLFAENQKLKTENEELKKNGVQAQ